MKSITVLVITFVLIVSSSHDCVFAQHQESQNMTTEQSNMVTPAQNAMMDAKKVGDTCMKNEQCTKNLGMYAECKMSKCICKRESQKSGDSMKCEMEKKNAAVRKFASMVCFALIVIVKMAL